MNRPVAPPAPPKAHPPNGIDSDMICRDAKIDTIFNSHEGETFAFKGSYYYKLTDNAVEEGYPRLIAEGWPGLSSKHIFYINTC